MCLGVASELEVGVGANAYRYNGIEHLEEYGLDLAFYRSYDPAIGRWMQVDPAAESFSSITPYNGMGNNPVLFTDLLGDSIKITNQNAYRGDARSALLSSLGDWTGLNLSISSEGIISYEMDEKGRPVISRGENGKKKGSKSARKTLINAINHEDMVTFEFGGGGSRVFPGTNTGVIDYGNHSFRLGPKLPGNRAEISSDLNSMTWEVGGIFLHELLHTQVGGGYLDEPNGRINDDRPGPTVRRVNRMRRQINRSLGMRMTYRPVEIGEYDYLAFSRHGRRQIRRGVAPTSMWIRYRN